MERSTLVVIENKISKKRELNSEIEVTGDDNNHCEGKKGREACGECIEIENNA